VFDRVNLDSQENRIEQPPTFCKILMKPPHRLFHAGIRQGPMLWSNRLPLVRMFCFCACDAQVWNGGEKRCHMSMLME
jgi:hypothetical protein